MRPRSPAGVRTFSAGLGEVTAATTLARQGPLSQRLWEQALLGEWVVLTPPGAKGSKREFSSMWRLARGGSSAPCRVKRPSEQRGHVAAHGGTLLLRDTSAIRTAPRGVARAGVGPPRQVWGLSRRHPSREGHTSPDRPSKRSDQLDPSNVSLQAAGPGKHPWTRGGQGHRAGPGPQLPARAPSSPGHPQPKDPQLPPLGP